MAGGTKKKKEKKKSKMVINIDDEEYLENYEDMLDLSKKQKTPIRKPKAKYKDQKERNKNSKGNGYSKREDRPKKDYSARRTPAKKPTKISFGTYLGNSLKDKD